MDMKPGTRLRSQVSPTEVIVVRADSADVDVRCGGQPMAGLDSASAAPLAIAAGLEEGVQLGKRYVDSAGSIELLVTKAGQGSLSLGTEPLLVKSAKPLPASD